MAVPRPDPDAERRGPKPSALEAWLERKLPPFSFGIVFLLLLGTYVLLASSPPSQWARVATVVLEGVTLLVTLVAARSGRLLFRIAAVVVFFAIVTAAASLAVTSSGEVTGWFFAMNVLLVGAAPIAIGRGLYERDLVDIRTVFGAICIYLLIGIMYAFLYAAIGAISSDPFFVQTHHAHLSIYLYFSYVTQTTVGYGDYTAATNLGRTLATSEALLGQLYLVTVIAVLVSRMASVHRPPARAEPAGGERTPDSDQGAR